MALDFSTKLGLQTSAISLKHEMTELLASLRVECARTEWISVAHHPTKQKGTCREVSEATSLHPSKAEEARKDSIILSPCIPH